jgi:hypothetical protein
MADLITSARAEQAINQAGFSTAESTAIASLVSAVSAAVVRWCRRDFVSTSYDELYHGTGAELLVLAQYPVLSVARVATRPVTVLTVRNTSSSNERATVAVTSTGLTLVRVASGVSSTDTSVTWAGNPTLAAVRDAVNALGNGWSATVPDSRYANRASADLRAIQGALNAAGVDAPIRLHVDELTDYAVDANRGWLIRGSGTGFPCWEAGYPRGPVWLPGIDNYRVLYTAGYATVPQDVQEACAEWVAALFWMTKDNPAAYPNVPPAHVATLLEQYRRIRLPASGGSHAPP